ncbi:phosphate ABC transporter permease subunit PstC [Alteribacillus sp. HJP-4]|uniref:phosphate ABC transporter permease subunit PstC n=1 Tax=Alteribacillus sp. HJP-4 TaxID=2775394 RepID=UPI0035CD1951
MANEKNNETVSALIREQKKKRGSWNQLTEKTVPIIFLICAVISIVTTVGIVLTLLFETLTFFNRVSFIEFISGTEWYPFVESSASYGILPLISGTLLITLIAVIVAVPIGLASAIYLSEYAGDRERRIIKPILEVLAGIPTIVYGYFALTFVTPLLQNFIDLSLFNALSPGIVVGIMIVPMIASLSEDAMNAVPNSMREGALAMGATRFEVARKIVVPAALSGIVASFVLAISRAIGETMIVTVAGGSTPRITADPTDSIQTMTAYIVQVSLGDASFGSTIYYSIYAVGMTLFVFTLLMNLLSQYITKKFREEY